MITVKFVQRVHEKNYSVRVGGIRHSMLWFESLRTMEKFRLVSVTQWDARVEVADILLNSKLLKGADMLTDVPGLI